MNTLCYIYRVNVESTRSTIRIRSNQTLNSGIFPHISWSTKSWHDHEILFNSNIKKHHLHLTRLFIEDATNCPWISIEFHFPFFPSNWGMDESTFLWNYRGESIQIRSIGTRDGSVICTNLEG